LSSVDDLAIPPNAARFSIFAAIAIEGKPTAAGPVVTWHGSASSGTRIDVTSKAPQEGSTTEIISALIAVAKQQKA
jgi:hypothetical protein